MSEVLNLRQRLQAQEQQADLNSQSQQQALQKAIDDKNHIQQALSQEQAKLQSMPTNQVDGSKQAQIESLTQELEKEKLAAVELQKQINQVRQDESEKFAGQISQLETSGEALKDELLKAQDTVNSLSAEKRRVKSQMKQAVDKYNNLRGVMRAQWQERVWNNDDMCYVARTEADKFFIQDVLCIEDDEDGPQPT